jgi:hypothetical protein
LVLFDLDAQPAAADVKAEGKSGQLRRQAGPEGQGSAVVAHPAEAGDRDDPGARE